MFRLMEHTKSHQNQMKSAAATNPPTQEIQLEYERKGEENSFSFEDAKHMMKEKLGGTGESEEDDERR